MEKQKFGNDIANKQNDSDSTSMARPSTPASLAETFANHVDSELRNEVSNDLIKNDQPKPQPIESNENSNKPIPRLTDNFAMVGLDKPKVELFGKTNSAKTANVVVPVEKARLVVSNRERFTVK